jgi:hypothetical protein
VSTGLDSHLQQDDGQHGDQDVTQAPLGFEMGFDERHAEDLSPLPLDSCPRLIYSSKYDGSWKIDGRLVFR